MSKDVGVNDDSDRSQDFYTSIEDSKSAVSEFIAAMHELGVAPTPIHFKRLEKESGATRFRGRKPEDIPGYTILGWIAPIGQRDPDYRYNNGIVIAADGLTYDLFQGDSPGAQKRFRKFVPVPRNPPVGLRKYLQRRVSKVVREKE